MNLRKPLTLTALLAVVPMGCGDTTTSADQSEPSAEETAAMEVSDAQTRSQGRSELARNIAGFIAGLDEPSDIRSDVGDGTLPEEPEEAFSLVSAAREHSCGLDPAGNAYCWGLNNRGQLGDGTADQIDYSTEPTAVDTDLTFVSLDAGGDHTCGVTTDEEVHCWGDNYRGQLGVDPVGGHEDTPVPADTDEQFDSVSAGHSHTCGVTTDEEVHCWGEFKWGQLGHVQPGPAAANTDEEFNSVSAGFQHTCGVTTDGNVYCWGSNDSGRLGDGTSDWRIDPEPVDATNLAADEEFLSVSSGQHAHSCGVTIDAAGDRSAYCWGRNEDGELGDGTTDERNIPTPVDTDALDGGEQFDSISAGHNYSCGMTTDDEDRREAFCWGDNWAGQLGDGAREDTTTPQPVTTDSLEPDDQFETVSTSRYPQHSCGVTTFGNAFCWGANDSGQLGDGTTDRSEKPVPVQQPDES